ncbi:MAG TPA: SPFH domain-containing protein [Nevskiaceae bacterium]|nr:SPFH domain-containing protein [Nevskiaceae bacterium]
MWDALKSGIGAIGRMLGQGLRALGGGVLRLRVAVVVLALIGGLAWAVQRHPPVHTLARGEVGLRTNTLTGHITEFGDGPVLVVPHLHRLKVFGLRDRTYRAEAASRADGPDAFQSVEGLSLGVDFSVRYALDPKKVGTIAAGLPDDIDGDVVAPAVQGVVYRILARYTVREIFSTKRAEIQQNIVAELGPPLAADGILLRGVQMGRVDLPGDYRQGMDRMLSEELEAERMKYTLTLKDQQVKQSALEAEAEKVRREKAAEAAGNEEIIAARAQAEAMKHVLPFKEKQIEQRRLEAEAEKVSRIRNAEATAEARRIEAAGEADSRRKLADADSYRMEQIGKVASAQLERDGELITKHPLLIQKTMADKLSDNVSVIIAPPSQDGFIGANLVGGKSVTGARQ